MSKRELEMYQNQNQSEDRQEMRQRVKSAIHSTLRSHRSKMLLGRQMLLNEPAPQVDIATRNLIMDQPLTRLISPFKRKPISGVGNHKSPEVEKEKEVNPDAKRVNRI